MTTQHYEFIRTDVSDSVAELVFNRPKVLNAFNNELMAETHHAMAEFDADEQVRVIVVRGEGRAFSAGFDLKAAAERNLDSVDKVRAQMERQFEFIMQFWHSAKPTIALTHGYCLAGAFELALACDLTYAASETFFGEPEVRFGSGIIAMLLPWITGPKQAKELLLTGNDRISAGQAKEIGIVNQVLPADQLLEHGHLVARNIASASQVSVGYTKQAINRSYEHMGLDAALRTGLDLDIMLNSTPSPEKAEFARIRRESGVKAAIEWRDKRFKPQQ